MENTTEMTFSSLRADIQKVYTEQGTFEMLKEMQRIMQDEKDSIIALLSKETKLSLTRFAIHHGSDKKERLVRAVYDNFLTYLIYGEGICYSPMQESWEDAYKRTADAQTPESFATFQHERVDAKKALQAALDNPVTLDDYRQFIRYKGQDALTSEQKIKYDELIADLTKDRRNQEELQRATAQAVSVDVDMEIQTSRHTKKDIPLWVVTMSRRVEREEYQELNKRAKKLGGYYSSFRGNGAIAGFTFEDEEAANLFMAKEEKVIPVEAIAGKKLTALEQACNNLRAKAQKFIDEGEESLGRDRKDNTHRRAAQAAHAENKAEYAIKFGKTMLKIADETEAGNIKYLDKINTATELEELRTVLNRAKRAFNQDATEKVKEGYTIEMAEHVAMPYPVLYKALAIPQLEKMATRAGKKLASNRLLKRLKSCKQLEDYTVTGASELADYYSVLVKGAGSDYEFQRYKEGWASYQRVKRIGLDSLPLLRSAIRELIAIESGAVVSPELLRIKKLRELERQFVGRKIDGFFPTPEELATQVVELADIQNGHSVLEPSAGLGHLAETIRAQHPDNDLVCVEVNYSLSEALKEKDFEVYAEDFMQFNKSSTVKFDRIVMNPPFENMQDIDHVMRAYEMLKEGGKLVAIMAAKNENDSRGKILSFIQFAHQRGEVIENPAGSFKSAFRPTGVSTITVILNK